ncbi:hypothetical protein [Amycolatopsis magusensis]|uniref:hypothetical protein n=1 Tax=Amycolatopsis magusensis TaxID=882444 RepID=UPI0037B073CE
MDSLEPAVHTATVGELACGSLFELDGTHEVGDWLTCPDHNVPTRISASFMLAPDGLIAG